MRGLVLGILVFLEKALKFLMLVATLAGQILLSVLKFVLIEFQLSFCQFQLVGGRAIGSRLFGQLGNERLVHGNLRLPSGGSVLKLFERTAGRGAGRGSFAKRGSKCLVEFMIGKAQRIPRERLLLRCVGESAHPLGTQEQAAVYR